MRLSSRFSDCNEEIYVHVYTCYISFWMRASPFCAEALIGITGPAVRPEGLCEGGNLGTGSTMDADNLRNYIAKFFLQFKTDVSHQKFRCVNQPYVFPCRSTYNTL